MVRMVAMMVLMAFLSHGTTESVGEHSVRIKRETHFRGLSSLPPGYWITWGIIGRRDDSWS